MSHDLEAKKREISVLVDEINAKERALKLPVIEGLDDYDRMEAMDILNRIERRMRANMKEPAA
ncbi:MULTISPECIES: hypothetical protein [unclassified Bradyrhizobium]|uniref:hypothetical protein n=1 Tax=unclassified Bradyrhizobium TaxID=2631580 RepID=UPI002478FB68|nr:MULTISPECIES: hypothetical protein [unclassified Bradyrhizobium]WGR74324.1 hypothetical protein MTX24_16500 [Bradyrhizobium sp. ISRA426]WGR79159.1 hypothetical protein MTX21_01615 [Bradyrhizobium sp. ISRA430]WGR90580.1 hypothetical protein MTX25_39760 [Bradyrhizobium sp. ISRA432]